MLQNDKILLQNTFISVLANVYPSLLRFTFCDVTATNVSVFY